ncbi:MAG: hypothetical protein WAN43_18090 [Rhodomicrobium sp.]
MKTLANFVSTVMAGLDPAIHLIPAAKSLDRSAASSPSPPSRE